jgi:hypothetical protein
MPNSLFFIPVNEQITLKNNLKEKVLPKTKKHLEKAAYSQILVLQGIARASCKPSKSNFFASSTILCQFANGCTS